MSHDPMQTAASHRATRPTPGQGRYVAAVVCCLVVSLSLVGCGYRVAETYPTAYATVSVPIFENRTFYKGIEFALAEALTKQITSRTPYRIASPGSADTVLQGSITRVEQFSVARTGESSLPEQMEMQVTVNFQWKDLRTGEDIIDRVGFTAVGRYIPTQPVGEAVQVAQFDAANSLAQDIVDQMRGDW